MRYIVVDFEMNPIGLNHRDARKIGTNEIIQIGAVMLNEDFQEIDCFSILVRPELNTNINRAVERLTGINISMLYDKPTFCEAVNKFFTWCLHDGDDIEIYQWSTNDYEQLIKEMQIKNYKPEDADICFAAPWIDLQNEYENKIGLSKAPSLEMALSYAGINFDGIPHDALNDARNTATLLSILRDDTLLKKQLEKTIEAFTPKKIESSLGAMFDFSQFVFS